MIRWRLSTLLLCTVLGATACPPPENTTDGGTAPPPADAGANTELTDPLSMPAEPTVNPAQFTSASDCASCHVDHYAAWRTSMHAYAMVDPVYRKLVALRQTQYQGRQDRFCLQCHSAIATRGGEIVPNFSFDNLSAIALEGVSCESCHRVTSVQRPYNSGHVLDPANPVQGPLPPDIAAMAHPAQQNPLFDSSQFCGGCHDVVEVNGLPLERPYQEWLESPAAATRKNCQSCHMPAFDGQAARNGPQRQGLHSHRFVGVDLPLEEGFVTEDERNALRTDVEGLLSGAATLTLASADHVQAGQQLDLELTVRNNIVAHNLPTGTTFIRQMWLEVTVEDSAGTVLYQTGGLDANGDLRNHYSELDPYGDQDLITLTSGLINGLGEPELFPWLAAEHISNSLSPLYRRTYTLFVPTTGAAAGPLQISARLRFRSHAPYLLRALGLSHLLSRLEIHDVTTGQRTITVDMP